MASEVSQQPAGVMGTNTFWRVAVNKEKPFKKVLGLIYRFNMVKWKNVLKIRHLQLIQWWYLCPGFYGS
jgi:hypothetical protein